MPKRRYAALAIGAFIAAAILGVWHLPAPQRAHAITNCDTSMAGLSGAEQQMLTLVNGARAAVGAPALKVSPNLNRAAAWKSTDQITNMPLSHTDSLGRMPATRATDCGYAESMAENIAMGYGSAQATFTAWMGSKGHMANILNPGYVVIGIGADGASWTLDFGFYDDSGQVDPPPTSTPTATLTRTPTTVPSGGDVPPPANTPPAAGAPPVAGITLQLSQGLNLVTYAGPSQPAESAMSSILPAVVEVARWNPGLGDWDHWSPRVPGYANSFEMLTPGAVYFIAVSNDMTWGY